ncbi:MAG: tungstate ABC transporter substrate-binding protein WtpA [Bacteroidales bacterium]|jgi:molybdate/tungstate transport system substrate-binding protein|nr:tungstate ABC transporter substrate-binding protein WtpA [Bacteroidales bacterium]
MIKRIFFLLALFFVAFPGCRNSVADRGKEIIIFHAGSLSVPFKQLADEYRKLNPGVKILMEPAGSLVCARKITELRKPCDIIASADYMVIDELIIPEYASWSIKFATNEIVIAYREESRYSSEIDSSNWIDILLRDDVVYSRSDPDSDPCGYRSVMTFKLAENYYGITGLEGKLTAKDRNFIRPKEVDLIALVEAGASDYMFQYKSVARQHNLKYIELPDMINLGNPLMNKHYNSVSVDVAGKTPDSKMTIRGDYINYSLAVLNDAPNSEGATDFVSFMLSAEGVEIFRRNGQDPVVPPETKQPAMIPSGLKKYLGDGIQ